MQKVGFFRILSNNVSLDFILVHGNLIKGLKVRRMTYLFEFLISYCTTNGRL